MGRKIRDILITYILFMETDRETDKVVFLYHRCLRD